MNEHLIWQRYCCSINISLSLLWLIYYFVSDKRSSCKRFIWNLFWTYAFYYIDAKCWWSINYHKLTNQEEFTKNWVRVSFCCHYNKGQNYPAFSIEVHLQHHAFSMEGLWCHWYCWCEYTADLQNIPVNSICKIIYIEYYIEWVYLIFIPAVFVYIFYIYIYLYLFFI